MSLTHVAYALTGCCSSDGTALAVELAATAGQSRAASARCHPGLSSK